MPGDTSRFLNLQNMFRGNCSPLSHGLWSDINNASDRASSTSSTLCLVQS